MLVLLQINRRGDPAWSPTGEGSHMGLPLQTRIH